MPAEHRCSDASPARQRSWPYGRPAALAPHESGALTHLGETLRTGGEGDRARGY